MIVKKNDGTSDELIMSFRYGFESELICMEIASDLTNNNIPYKIYKPNIRCNTYRIIIDNIYMEFFKPEIILSINSKYSLSNSCFDIFLGINSKQEIGGFSIPRKVLNAICIIGANVEISYACS